MQCYLADLNVNLLFIQETLFPKDYSTKVEQIFNELNNSTIISLPYYNAFNKQFNLI